MLPRIDGIDADSNLRILENGTEPLLAFLYGLLASDSLRDVLDRHHCSHNLISLPNWRGAVLYAEATSVLLPEDFVRRYVALPIVGGLGHPTIFCRVWRSIGIGVMNGCMHRLANEFLRLIAQHSSACRIHKCNRPICAESPDAIRH